MIRWNRGRDGDKTFPTMGWMQFRLFRRFIDSRQIANTVGFYSNSLICGKSRARLWYWSIPISHLCLCVAVTDQGRFTWRIDMASCSFGRAQMTCSNLWMYLRFGPSPRLRFPWMRRSHHTRRPLARCTHSYLMCSPQRTGSSCTCSSREIQKSRLVFTMGGRMVTTWLGLCFLPWRDHSHRLL